MKAVVSRLTSLYCPAMSLQRLLVVAFWSAALFALIMASLPQPPSLPGRPDDKIQHVIAFVTLATLATLAYPRVSPIRIGISLSAFGALIEFIQMIPSLHRDAELADWIADTFAAAVILAMTALLRRRFRRA